MQASISQLRLRNLPRLVKSVIFLFALTVLVGLLAAMAMVENTTSLTAQGIEENYLGNEDNPDAETMRFKKSDYEILNIIHTHVLSLSVLFLILALLVYFCEGPLWLKSVVMIEPMISLIFTFGGMFLLWIGLPFMEFVMMISGVIMLPCIVVSIMLILRETLLATNDDFASV